MNKTKNRSRVLALVIMLALVLAILPMGAMASATSVYVRFYNAATSGVTQIGAVSVTAPSDTAYSAIMAAITSLGSSVITSYDVDANGINSINGLAPGDTTDNDNDAWLYAVNDKLAEERISDMAISSGDVITVFYAENFNTTLFAYIVPDGAATIGNAIAADSSDTFYYRVATSTVDFNNLYSTINSTSQSVSGVSYVTASPTVTGYAVIPAYKRVVGTGSDTFDDWKAETLAAYGNLTSDQKTSLSNEYAAASASTATMSDVNALAKEVAPLARKNSALLKRLVFTQSSDYLNIVQNATGKNGFDPDVTSYRLQMVTGGLNVAAEALSDNTVGITYSSSGSGMSVSSSGAITFSAAGTYTLTVTVSNTIETGNTVTKSYTIVIPYTAGATSNVPKTVCGYLPIGQFARPNSMGWGTIYTDNTNVYASTKTPKFTAGYVSTGVSLGMLGGYVQYEFADAIGNDADNPYGIDFIVYGNAFNGNPEAGAVMVYGKNTATNNYGWYNLAGSRHYMSGTVKNEDITYIKITAANTSLNSAFTAAGIYYSKDFVKPASDTQTLVDAQVGAATWTSITTATGWWPEIGNNENYEQVWKMHRPDTTTVGQTGIDSDVGGVYWYTSGTALVIRYEGVTEVIDSNTTDDYQWGYADVRGNGSSYGTAINPYATSASSSTGAGGDGFDLSWAVDPEGKPVNLTDVKIVRVYSAVLFNAGVFGETSTEVNGIYVANKASASVGATSAPSVSMTFTKAAPRPSSTTISPTLPTSSGGTVNYISTMIDAATTHDTTTYDISVTASTGDNVFVNGVKLTESATPGVFTGTGFTVPTTTQKVQILVQSGYAAPYIVVLT